MNQQSTGKETGQQYAPRRDDIVQLPWAPWGRIHGPEPTPDYVPEIPAIYDRGEAQRNRGGGEIRIPLYAPLDGPEDVSDSGNDKPLPEREGDVAIINYTVQPRNQGEVSGIRGPEFPRYRTALDDAIDGLTSDRTYNRNTNPGDAERERQARDRFSDWFHGRRNKF